jgi:predicted dehydrogenase
MHDITVAVAGVGFIGPVHIEALRRLGVRVKGVLDVTPELSRKAQERLGLEHAYLHFHEMLEDEEVQAIHLAVPNVLHYQMAKQALRAGKHVMCEKPLAMNSEESGELVQIARDSGCVAGVNYNIRFYPMNLEARSRVEGGHIGRVFSVTGSYVQDWLLYDTDYNWRVLAEEGGVLRAVADIGTHWMDLVGSITGLEVEAVFADLRTVHPVRKRPVGEVETYSGKSKSEEDLVPVDITTEDSGAIIFRFAGGAQGVLWVSQVTAGRKNTLRYEIAGEKASLAWSSETPNELWLGYRDRPNEVFARDPSLLSARAQGYSDYPGGHNEGFPDTFKQCHRAFYEAVKAGGADGDTRYPTFAEGHREVELCEAILESHRRQAWVELGS